MKILEYKIFINKLLHMGLQSEPINLGVDPLKRRVFAFRPIRQFSYLNSQKSENALVYRFSLENMGPVIVNVQAH